MEQEIQKITENLAPAKQDRKPIEAIKVNVSRAENALRDKLIDDCTEDEIKVKLILIYSMVGLRSQFYPVNEEKKNLHDYIRLKFGKKTLSELVLAFDLAINNELELKPDDVKVYDQFTISYLALIMSAYKLWLSHQSKQVKKDTPMIEEKKELTDEEKMDWIEEWKAKEVINIELIPVMFYDFLSDKGLLPVTNKQKWEYLEKAKQFIKGLLLEDMNTCKTNDAYQAWNKFQNMEANGFEGDFKDRILNRSKKLIVFDYLKVNANNSKTF